MWTAWRRRHRSHHFGDGCLNVTKRAAGREVRTVAIDPRPADPWSAWRSSCTPPASIPLGDLPEEMYDRGLLARPTRKHPEQAVSTTEPPQMLRDRYYPGCIEYDDEEIKGRHELLIDEDLFDRAKTSSPPRIAGERHRTLYSPPTTPTGPSPDQGRVLPTHMPCKPH